ncbi:hypothetical protein DEU56DRAFT_522014 [Suillus clintonianus]|uniref:uncharacterized protein n=1 Tax=Suillus clintonianus TaxID=1904413 RepID=UPI001B87436A|nr:uncharacterized protein DEU56DRAFT_522014 [Suillus clintonianus]KAG2152932.1 hypothetical protein DEU56DRAFT_522014 [Suillus clintonianus]
MAYTTPASQASVLKPSKESVQAKLVGSFPERFIGAMPVCEFLDNFLPAGDDCPVLYNDEFPVVENTRCEEPKPERTTFEHFMMALRKFTANFDLVDTSSCPDPSVVVDGHEFQPDIALYKSGSARKGVTDMSAMEAWITIKPSMQQDPFHDPYEDFQNDPYEGVPDYHSFELDGKQSISTRAYMLACANAFFATQFRRFGFSILICGSCARFVRWDRAGALVSMRFDYTKDVAPLAYFLWSLNCASPEDRGVDVSVIPLSLSQTLDPPTWELLGMGSSDPLYGYIVPVDTALQNTVDAQGRPLPTHRFYVGPRPTSQYCSLLEQRTRAFHVWDPQQKKVVFFKESWRQDSQATTPESEIYRVLRSRRISNIPSFEHGGDMAAIGAKTVTHSFNEASWCCVRTRKATPPLIQHRIILRDVGRPLSTVTSTDEIVVAIRDALRAHQSAYERLGLLHRNINMANIGIASDGSRLLMGWECSSFTSRGGLWQTQMGTPAFMSGELLDKKANDKRHKLADDLESFLHVMMYILGRYIPNNMNAEERNTFFQIFDEEYVIDGGGRAVGGSHKRKCLAKPDLYFPKSFTPDDNISYLLRLLCEMFSCRYDPWAKLCARPGIYWRASYFEEAPTTHYEMIRDVDHLRSREEWPEPDSDDC